MKSLHAFPASRTEALERLRWFVPHAGRDYTAGRNTDLGPGHRPNVSGLSPYLRHRMITEHEVVATVLARHSLRAAEKFVQEVLWRTYWKGWLEMRPAVWVRFLSERDLARDSCDRTDDLLAAERGTTGIEGFDDWARELVQTGYLHNHARMWFASIWIFTLRLPWALGADFFLRHLIDADPASNTLSWRWVAGLQTAGKTYLATADNIARYTEGRFSPKGLAVYAEALSERPLPAAGALSKGAETPLIGPSLLLVTGDDLHPESLVSKTEPIAGSLIASRADATWPWGNKASAFLAAATKDAVSRIGSHYGCTVHLTATLDSNAILAAAEAVKAKTIVTPHAPIGPIADALTQLESSLSAEGSTLIRRRRSWDDRFWPHAKKGFFSFKEHIAEELMHEGIATAP